MPPPTTTREFLKAVEDSATKRLNEARMQKSKIDPKDTAKLAELTAEIKVLADIMIYCDSARLNAGLKP
jgi:phage host-nuclease inhibitor protein Gam